MIEDPSTGAEQRSPEVTSAPAPESKPAPAAAPAQRPEGAKLATEVRAAKELEGVQAGKAGADPAPLVSAAGQDAPSSEGKEAKPASGPRRRTSKAKASEKKGSANKQDGPAKKKQAGQKAVSAKAKPAGQQDGPVAEKPAEQVEPAVKKDPVEQKEAPVKVGPADQQNAPVAEKPVEQAEPSAKKEPAARVDAPRKQESAEREEGAATTRPTAPDQAPADSVPVSQDTAAADVASAKPAPVKRTRTRNKSRGPVSRKDDKVVSEKSKEDAAPEVVDAAVAVSQQEATAPEAAPAPAPSRVRHHSADEIDFDKAGVDELRDLAMHRRRGRPSPQKEEARQTISSSSLFTRTHQTLLHHSDPVIINEAVLLLSRECEEIDGYADVITECFRDERASSQFGKPSLVVLVDLLKTSEDMELVMDLLKFLALLVYSVKSLSKRVFVVCGWG